MPAESVPVGPVCGAGPKPSVAVQEPQGRTWSDELRLAVRDAAHLVAALELPVDLIPPARQAARSFPVFAPWTYIARMSKGDATDPLLRQVLPIADELAEQPGFNPDPVGDEAARLAPGLLQKYSGRALFITTGACAVHCRYCFRRQYPLPSASSEVVAPRTQKRNTA